MHETAVCVCALKTRENESLPMVLLHHVLAEITHDGTVGAQNTNTSLCLSVSVCLSVPACVPLWL